MHPYHTTPHHTSTQHTTILVSNTNSTTTTHQSYPSSTIRSVRRSSIHGIQLAFPPPPSFSLVHTLHLCPRRTCFFILLFPLFLVSFIVLTHCATNKNSVVEWSLLSTSFFFVIADSLKKKTTTTTKRYQLLLSLVVLARLSLF